MAVLTRQASGKDRRVAGAGIAEDRAEGLAVGQDIGCDRPLAVDLPPEGVTENI